MTHLTVCPRLGLAVKVKVRAVGFQKCRHAVHILTKNIFHLPTTIAGGGTKPHAGKNTCQLRELAGGTSFDCPVKGIVRARCHFVE